MSSSPTPLAGDVPAPLRSHWRADVAPLLQHLLGALFWEWLVWQLYQGRSDDQRLVLFFFAGMAVLVGNGGVLWYRVAMLRSRVLRADAEGIHLEQGLLPWKKQRRALGWEEIAAIVCRPGTRWWPFATDTLTLTARDPAVPSLHMPGVRDGATEAARLERARR